MRDTSCTLAELSLNDGGGGGGGSGGGSDGGGASFFGAAVEWVRWWVGLDTLLFLWPGGDQRYRK